MNWCDKRFKTLNMGRPCGEGLGTSQICAGIIVPAPSRCGARLTRRQGVGTAGCGGLQGCLSPAEPLPGVPRHRPGRCAVPLPPRGSVLALHSSPCIAKPARRSAGGGHPGREIGSPELGSHFNHGSTDWGFWCAALASGPRCSRFGFPVHIQALAWEATLPEVPSAFCSLELPQAAMFQAGRGGPSKSGCWKRVGRREPKREKGIDPGLMKCSVSLAGKCSFCSGALVFKKSA